MPILAFGKFTVHGGGSTTELFQSHATEFIYYSMAPILWILAVLSCVFAIRFHQRIDPTYSATKVWALAPAYAALLALYLIHASAAYPLLSVTIVLLAWRWRKPVRIIPAYFDALLALAFINALLLFAVIQEVSAIGMILFASLLPAGFMAIPICIIRVILRTHVTWRQCMIAYAVGTLVPVIPLLLFFASSTDGIPTAFLLLLGFVSLTTLPFIALIKWNPWVRDLVNGTLFVKTDNPE